MKPGRVISGDEHDARAEARRLLDEARAEAERVVAEARRRAAELEAQAQHARAAAGAGEGAPEAAAGTVDEVTGLVVRATVGRVSLGEVVRIDRRDRGP